MENLLFAFATNSQSVLLNSSIISEAIFLVSVLTQVYLVSQTALWPMQ